MQPRASTPWMTGIGILLITSVILLVSNPTIFIHRSSERNYAVKSTMTGLIVAIKQYQAEYNKLPEEPSSHPTDRVPIRTRGAILRALMGEKSEINPRGIRFLDPPLVKDKRAGLYYDEQNSPVLVDSWGEPYYLLLDIDGDGQIPDPDSSQNEGDALATSIAMFSSGPDRDPKTWKDNVASWK